MVKSNCALTGHDAVTGPNARFGQVDNFCGGFHSGHATGGSGLWLRLKACCTMPMHVAQRLRILIEMLSRVLSRSWSQLADLCLLHGIYSSNHACSHGQLLLMIMFAGICAVVLLPNVLAHAEHGCWSAASPVLVLVERVSWLAVWHVSGAKFVFCRSRKKSETQSCNSSLAHVENSYWTNLRNLGGLATWSTPDFNSGLCILDGPHKELWYCAYSAPRAWSTLPGWYISNGPACRCGPHLDVRPFMECRDIQVSQPTNHCPQSGTVPPTCEPFQLLASRDLRAYRMPLQFATWLYGTTRHSNAGTLVTPGSMLILKSSWRGVKIDDKIK